MQRLVLKAYVDDYLTAQRRANTPPATVERNRAILEDFLEYVVNCERLDMCAEPATEETKADAA